MESRRQPVAMQLAFRDLIGQHWDTSEVSFMYVVPDEQAEAITLVSICHLVVNPEEARQVKERVESAPWMKIRRAAKRNGLKMPIRRTQAGGYAASFERILTKGDLQYTVTPTDQSTFAYPLRQVKKFSSDVEATVIELRRIAIDSSKQANSGGGCFIATSVYGSYDCGPVWVLRRWRDEQLLVTAVGRAFVGLYYRTSPALVRHFGDKRWFAKSARAFLDSLVGRLISSGTSDHPYRDVNLR